MHIIHHSYIVPFQNDYSQLYHFLLKTITMHIINIQQFIETKSMMKMIETSIEDLMTML